MYVDRISTRDVLQVAENTRVTQLAALMRDHRIRHLPVVRDGRLVGLVTSHDLERVSPSPVTTLSVGEANYLLGKLDAGRVMRAKVVFQDFAQRSTSSQSCNASGASSSQTRISSSPFSSRPVALNGTE